MDNVSKLKSWLKNPYNFGLIIVVVFAFLVRLYFFNLNSGHPLWWDEAEYMATAKKLAFNIPFEISPHRPPLFMYLAALLFEGGFGENAIQFWLVLVPSLALVVATFYLGKEMYDEKVGIIAALLMAVNWSILFWTARIQPDFFSMFFQVLAVFFMWKHWKNPNAKFVILAGVFSALGFHFKVSGLLAPLIIGVFSFVKDRFSIFKQKYYYYFLLAFILSLIPYIVWSYLSFNSITPLAKEYSDDVLEKGPFGWYTLNFFIGLTTPGLMSIGQIFTIKSILFVLFLVGLIMALEVFLYGEVLIKDRKKCFNADLFCITTLVIVSAFYIFWIKGADDRWVFLWLPFVFVLTGKAVLFVYDTIKKHQKTLAFLVVGLFLLIGVYAQLQHANNLIKIKKDSYKPVKDAALWIKENSLPSDKVSTLSVTQTVYYSERNVTNYAKIESIQDFLEYLKKEKPRYVIYSIYEPAIFNEKMKWFMEYLQSNPEELNPVQAYFLDAQKKQLALVIFEVNYGKLGNITTSD